MEQPKKGETWIVQYGRKPVQTTVYVCENIICQKNWRKSNFPCKLAGQYVEINGMCFVKEHPSQNRIFYATVSPIGLEILASQRTSFN